jgi:hypothetical protein
MPKAPWALQAAGPEVRALMSTQAATGAEKLGPPTIKKLPRHTLSPFSTCVVLSFGIGRQKGNPRVSYLFYDFMILKTKPLDSEALARLVLSVPARLSYAAHRAVPKVSGTHLVISER